MNSKEETHLERAKSDAKQALLDELDVVEKQIQDLKKRERGLLNMLVERHALHRKGDIVEDRRGSKIQVKYVEALPHSMHGAIWQTHGLKLKKDGTAGTRRDSIISRI